MDTGHKWTDRELTALEKRIATVYRRAYKDIGRTIRDYFDKFAARDDEQRARLDAGEITNAEYTRWRLTQMGRGERYKALQERVAERMYNANTVALEYVNDTTPGIYTLNRNWTAYTIEQAGANASFTLWDESTVRRLIVEQPQLMPNYPKAQAVRRGIDLAYSKRQIGSAVTSGILQGHSVGKIAAEVQRHVTDMSWTSATRAARTAVTAAQNGGRQDTYEAAQKMGIELKKEWVATLDNRTRHAHAMADGQVAAVDKPFKLDGYDLMFPGDKSAPGYLVYNCRCTTIAAFKDYGKDAKRRSIDGVGEDMTYQEWAKSKKQQQKAVEASTIQRYNSTVKVYADVDAQSVYSAAKSGGRNKGVYADAVKKRQKNLEKSIASHTAQVEEHAKKIQNPEKYDAGWGEKDDRQKQGLLKKWGKDLRRNAEQAEIEIEVWKERFGNEQ